MQRELREVPGRHRADLRPDLRGREAPPPQARHAAPTPTAASSSTSAVCEGCGDCRRTSNCLSVVPVRDRVRAQAPDRPVDLQQGLSPAWRASARASSRSRAARPRKRAGADRGSTRCSPLPARARAAGLERPWRILVAGIGGTGVVTIGAAARHGRAPGGQGRRRARPDRPRPEGRRASPATCASRAEPDDIDRRAQHRRGRRRPAARLRPGAWPPSADALAPLRRRAHPRGGQRPRHRRPATSPAIPTPLSRRAAARAHRRRRTAPSVVDFVDATALADRAARRFHRRQLHAAGLRLAEGPGAAVAQRRIEQRHRRSTASPSSSTSKAFALGPRARPHDPAAVAGRRAAARPQRDHRRLPRAIDELRRAPRRAI